MPPRKQRKTSATLRPKAGDADVDLYDGSAEQSKAARATANLSSFPANKTHRLLESGPVTLISTRSKDGKSNLMTCGLHMCLQHDDPALIAFSLGEWDHSFTALKETQECVVCVPGVDLAEKVVDVGNCSGDVENKWEKFGFTQVPGEKVRAPLVGEALACIECKVHDRSNVRKYSMWILEPVRVWVNEGRGEKRAFHHKGDGTFVIDGEGLDLKERMTKWKYLQD